MSLTISLMVANLTKSREGSLLFAVPLGDNSSFQYQYSAVSKSLLIEACASDVTDAHSHRLGDEN